MNHEKVTEFLGALPASSASRTGECPDDHDLASAADGILSPEMNEQVRRHLADCDFCIRQLGLLARLPEHEPDLQVSEFVLARAGHLATARKPQPGKNAVRWAAAAVVVLATSLIVFWNSSDTGAPEFPEANAPAPELRSQEQLRKLGPHVSAPAILSPAEGAPMTVGNQVIRWSEATGSLYYDVRVVSDDGQLIWTERVEATETRLPENLNLEPGIEYFVRVDAYLSEARKVSSRHVLFTVAEER